MTTLKVTNIHFNGENAHKRGDVKFTLSSINGFSHNFVFGKSFLLESQDGGIGLTLSWLIAGRVTEDYGQIKKDDVVYDTKKRNAEVWFVRSSIVKTRRFSLREPTVKEQIRHGLSTINNGSFSNEQEVVSFFHLTPERYQRPLRVLSTEAWRASCAIGFVNGKSIFCFPHMDATFIADYYDLWFKEMIDFLTSAGSLVLIPTTITDVTSTLCDHIVTFE